MKKLLLCLALMMTTSLFAQGEFPKENRKEKAKLECVLFEGDFETPIEERTGAHSFYSNYPVEGRFHSETHYLDEFTIITYAKLNTEADALLIHISDYVPFLANRTEHREIEKVFPFSKTEGVFELNYKRDNYYLSRLNSRLRSNYQQDITVRCVRTND